MPLLDLQRRGQQIGRIRIGEQVSTGKKDKDGNDKMRPSRLSTFRFTTQSRPTAEAIAELYGGTIRDWNGEFEVITKHNAIGVTVPPRDQVVSQWYEKWTAGGCERRCDSRHEQITGGPCLCPHAEDLSDANEVAAKALERADMARENPPRACKLVTRISVMIPDLPGLGVFRLDSGSYYAAVEIGDSAALMQMARDKGVFLPAVLRIEHRKRVAGGQTKKYPVPVLEVLTTFRAIANGELQAGGIAAQLPPAPGEQRRAIAAGAAVPVQREAPKPEAPAWERMTKQQKAEHIVGLAAKATASAEIEQLNDQADAEGIGDDHVCTDRAEDIWEEVRSHLQARWRELHARETGGRP